MGGQLEGREETRRRRVPLQGPRSNVEGNVEYGNFKMWGNEILRRKRGLRSLQVSHAIPRARRSRKSCLHGPGRRQEYFYITIYIHILFFYWEYIFAFKKK